ncbi:unnamed protein product [Prorocentrum cordatum]|uniref:Uncharacterized protein n=1 Tax=Prorocentrum cordatum TaxID=2364126 RepID=A0ABN9UBF1_9DINO|nr:unnamed protein product [Polarella glacialis]
MKHGAQLVGPCARAQGARQCTAPSGAAEPMPRVAFVEQRATARLPHDTLMDAQVLALVRDWRSKPIDMEAATLVSAEINSELGNVAAGVRNADAAGRPNQTTSCLEKFFTKSDWQTSQDPRLSMQPKLKCAGTRMAKLGCSRPSTPTLKRGVSILLVVACDYAVEPHAKKQRCHDLKEVIQSWGNNIKCPMGHVRSYPHNPSDLREDVKNFAYDVDHPVDSPAAVVSACLDASSDSGYAKYSGGKGCKAALKRPAAEKKPGAYETSGPEKAVVDNPPRPEVLLQGCESAVALCNVIAKRSVVNSGHVTPNDLFQCIVGHMQLHYTVYEHTMFKPKAFVQPGALARGHGALPALAAGAEASALAVPRNVARSAYQRIEGVTAEAAKPIPKPPSNKPIYTYKPQMTVAPALGVPVAVPEEKAGLGCTTRVLGLDWFGGG